MRAILLTAPNGRDNLQVTEVPEPKPGSGEVLVNVSYAGCNFADTMMRVGTYPHPKGYPLVAGLEVAGPIVAIGPDVMHWKPGMRVAAFSEEAGGFAERCIVPAERLIQLPDTMGFDVGAAFVIQALTAWNMLHNVSRTAPGDHVLIHAIGGGVGLYLTQLAVRAGATVFGTVGTHGKERRALEYGAKQVFHHAEQDFVAGVMEATKGRGVDKLLDSVGGTVLDRSFAVMRRLGHIVSIGEAEGPPLPDLWQQLVLRSLTFTRFHLGHCDFGSEIWRRAVTEVLDDIVQSWLKVPIEAVFALDDAAAMYARLESRSVSGKLLLAVQPELSLS